MHAMVASADASCKVFSASRTLDPHALFEKVAAIAKIPHQWLVFRFFIQSLIKHANSC